MEDTASVKRHPLQERLGGASEEPTSRRLVSCDRCRLKKLKCNGNTPCDRCGFDNAHCAFGEWKKLKDKIFPKRYVEILEKQQAQLINSIQELHRIAVPRLPRPGTFKGEDSERRERLHVGNPEEPHYKSRPASQSTATRRQIPTPSESPDLYGLTASVPRPDNAHDESEIERRTKEADERWILNLSMAFRDDSERLKFLNAYAQTSTEWKQPIDAVPHSLEQELRTLPSQCERNPEIYDPVQRSLPNISAYNASDALRIRQGSVPNGTADDSHCTESNSSPVDGDVNFQTDTEKHTNASWVTSEEGYVDQHCSPFESGSLLKPCSSATTPPMPPEFKELFPSTGRMYIKHEDTVDGNMNLRVDTGQPTFSGRDRDQTFYQFRTQDLKAREFSLRRYARDPGREVSQTSQKDKERPKPKPFRRGHGERLWASWASEAGSGTSTTSSLGERDLAKTLESGEMENEHFDAPLFDVAYKKLKQGLSGFANGAKVAALADTGSRESVMSESCARNLGLKPTGSTSSFELGNRRKIQSIGTVSFLWAFAENPTETISVPCHVLPRCTYDLILGNGFLTATETMSKYRRRLTKCLFSVKRYVSHFGFLGDSYQRLGGRIGGEHHVLAVPDSGAERNVMDLQYAIDNGFLGDSYQRLGGRIGGEHHVLAVPDSGAERNVMDLQYAIDNGFRIRRGPQNRGYLQFADGSYEETVGQVSTSWTFESGQTIPVTFEVLENCISDVIIGEDILTRYNVYEEHASSLVRLECQGDSYELAPFDYMSSWQRTCGRLVGKLKLKRGSPVDNASSAGTPATTAHAEEQHLRDIWNYKNDFGASANPAERELEMTRRRAYDSSLPPNTARSVDQRGSASVGRASEHRIPLIPSIRTAQTRR
ncbi:hypothetical protein MMC30_005945 [Trapelia coarctata]|nr:hypothetical protein [Trapelia coarctata]